MSASEVEGVSGEKCCLEIQARHLLDVTFKFTWNISNYLKDIEEGLNMDSPHFDINVNGIKSKWSMALRFWTDEDGRRLTNPVVVCLNLISSSLGIENTETETLQIRYHFGVWNDIVKHFELSPMGNQKITLSQQQQSLQSIAVRDILVLDRHLIDGKNIEIICKVMLIRDKVEQHTLALDLWNKLVNKEKTDIILCSSDGDSFPAHKLLLSSRSPVLAKMMEKTNGTISPLHTRKLKVDKLTLEMSTPILKTLLQYIYTDRVEHMDEKNMTDLIRFGDKLELPGLKSICERTLIDSITPANVASVLLIADNFNCDLLKKACMAYCEDNPQILVKTVAWKVMEQVNPELFEQVSQQ